MNYQDFIKGKEIKSMLLQASREELRRRDGKRADEALVNCSLFFILRLVYSVNCKRAQGRNVLRSFS